MTNLVRVHKGETPGILACMYSGVLGVFHMDILMSLTCRGEDRTNLLYGRAGRLLLEPVEVFPFTLEQNKILEVEIPRGLKWWELPKEWALAVQGDAR